MTRDQKIIRAKAGPLDLAGLRLQWRYTFEGSGAHCTARPTRSDVRSKLLAAIAMARGWLDDLVAGRVLDAADIAVREKRSVRSVSTLLSLAFHAPPLVQAIADHRLPRGVGLTRLAELPSEWPEQFVALGLQPPRYLP